MASYLELLQKRIDGEQGGATTTVDILVDSERYGPLRAAWTEAKSALDAAVLRLEHLRATQVEQQASGTRRRLNQPSPIAAAERDLAEATDAEAQARAAVQACFLRAHLAAPNAAISAEVAAKVGSDQPAIYDELIRRCLLRVTTTDGEPVEEITPDIFADYVAVAPIGERTKIVRALDDACLPVDLPTSPAS